MSLHLSVVFLGPAAWIKTNEWTNEKSKTTLFRRSHNERDLKQILEDVGGVEHLSGHEVIVSGRQLATEWLQGRVDGLQCCRELGQSATFEARINQRTQQHVGTSVHLQNNSTAQLPQDNKLNIRN